MSEVSFLSTGDFAWQRLTWMRTYRPVSSREVSAIITDWRNGLSRLPYLKITKTEQDTGWDSAMTVRCSTKLPVANLSIVQADLERIWRNAADGMEANYTVRKTEKGFIFEFTGLTPLNNTITGEVVVDSLAA